MTADDRTSDGTAADPAAGHDGIPRYDIRVEGHLGPRWSAWFDGLDLTREDDGTTVIHGPVVDQAALHGLLQRLRDVGVPLLSLTRLPPHDTTEPPAPGTNEGN